MTFITPELLTCLGIALALGLSTSGSSFASSVSGAYITRYNQSLLLQQQPSPSPSSAMNLGSFVKPFIPIIISGVLAIYGFIVAVLLALKYQTFESTPPDLATGYKYLAAGLSVGLACRASGTGLHDFLADFVFQFSPNAFTKQHDTVSTITRNNNSNNSNADADSSLVEPLLLGGSSDAQSKNTETIKAFPEPNIHFCMTLVYLEAIGLYGLIVALLLISF